MTIGQWEKAFPHDDACKAYLTANRWSGIVGSYHKVSRKYLPLYVAEFEFRYNNRMNEDIFRTAIRGC